jgi:hypothetical protein
MLRRTFGPKRDEVTGSWRKLHDEELRNLYSSPCIIRMIKPRRMRWARHAARTGERRNAYRILVGNTGGMRPLGRPRRRWEDNNKMEVTELDWGEMDWIDLLQEGDQWRALVNTLMNLRFHKMLENLSS